MTVAAAFQFADPIVAGLNFVLFAASLAAALAAFLHCTFQRGEAFHAVGTLPKGAWLGLTGGGAVLILLANWSSMLGMIGVVGALVYLLDVRPALRDIVDGHGQW